MTRMQNTKFHYSLIEEDSGRELVAVMTFADAVAEGNHAAKNAGHNGFLIMSLRDRVIESWAPA